MWRSNPGPLQCSFCGRSQDSVAKLISSPSDYPRSYICNECVEKNTSEELRLLSAAPIALPDRPTHCLMCHPDAFQLLAVIERWALAERTHADSAAELADLRRLARAMMGMDPA